MRASVPASESASTNLNTNSGSEGLLDALNDITDKMRKELMGKIDSLEKRVYALENETERQAAIEKNHGKQLKSLDSLMTDHETRIKNLED